MQFVEAFNALGYQIENQRQDWSAEKEDGVCLSLWTKETDWKAMVCDSRIHGTKLSNWGHKLGNKKRIRHAQRAIAEFGGWIDVVKIEGEPGVSYGTASPWLAAERKGLLWKITFLDPETGHIRLEAQPKHSSR